jgi:tetratricopeptide (TPR) repeat protein
MSRFSATPARLIALGDAWQAKGNTEESVQLWKRATRLHLARPAHARLADHFLRIGDQAQATRHRGLVAHAEGLDAFRSDRLPEGAKSFATAVELVPDQAHSWFYLGECRRLLDEPASAGEAYRRCLELNRYHGRARRALERLKNL